MKKFYEKFCKFEENLALWLLAGLTILVFVSAMMRTIGFPLNWAQDAALVAFAWMIFFGSDIALRGPGLIGVDLFVKKMPFTVQKIIDIIFKIAIIVFLVILVINGITMTIDGWDREITTLGISYSFVTMAVPVGSFFMTISMVINLVKSVKELLAHKKGAETV